MSFEIAFCTHRGSTPGQQDSVLIDTQVYQADDLESQPFIEGSELLLAVADGLAVNERSGFVSRALLSALPSALKMNPEWLREGLLSNRHLREAHLVLCQRAERIPHLRGGASKIVAAHIREDRVAILNCGDSRAYIRFADGNIRQLSRDHTELQQLRESGVADKGVQYASLYDRLTDCIETDPDESDFAIHRVETRLGAGDLLVLCSDGVHDMLSEYVWHDILRAASDTARLVSATRRALLQAGASDNFSAIAVAVVTAG